MTYEHKDTPDSWWERMRMIHGDDIQPKTLTITLPESVIAMALAGLLRLSAPPEEQLAHPVSDELRNMYQGCAELIKRACPADSLTRLAPVPEDRQ